MASGNWIVENLNNALNTWNDKLSEIWGLITQSPETFKGGDIWDVIVTIHDAVKGIGLGLLVLFFVVGVMKTLGSFAEMKRPEVAVKVFIRFVIAKAAVTYGLDLMMALFKIVQGLMSTIIFISPACLLFLPMSDKLPAITIRLLLIRRQQATGRYSCPAIKSSGKTVATSGGSSERTSEG